MRELPEKPEKQLRSDPSLTDSELLTLFQENPHHAWRLFIDRYANAIFSLIRSLGFDYDSAMDRFVFVCEKLSAKDFHRLKTIRYAGSHGDLTRRASGRPRSTCSPARAIRLTRLRALKRCGR